MKIRAWAMLVLAIVASAGVSAQMQASSITAVWVQNDATHAAGQGVFLKSGNGCFLYSAAHLLAPEGNRAETVTFRVRGGQALSGKVRWTPQDSPAEFDVGVIEAAVGATPADCPEIPTPTLIDKALDSSEGEILLIGNSGARTRIPVRIVRAEPRIVARPTSTRDQVSEGYSGAPLVVDGIVVGLVSSVDNTGPDSQINIIRLDAAPVQARAWLAPPEKVAGPISDNFVDSVCGGKVTGAPRGVTEPIGGIDAILTVGNGDCLIADPGRSIALEVRLCPGAEAMPITLVSIARGSQVVGPGNYKSRPLVTVSAAGEGQSFRPIGTGKSFGDVTIQPGALRDVSRLRVEIPGSPGFRESLCSISVH